MTLTGLFRDGGVALVCQRAPDGERAELKGVSPVGDQALPHENSQDNGTDRFIWCAVGLLSGCEY